MIKRGGLAVILSMIAAAVVVVGCQSIESPEQRADAELEALPLLRLEQELRIGDVNDPVRGFSRIGGVALDKDGNIFVREDQGVAIRVFSTEGSYVRTLGTRGDGPGEFAQKITRMGVKGDTVWAMEFGPIGDQRIALFTRSGELILGARGPVASFLAHSGTGRQSPMHMRADGKMVADVPFTVSTSVDQPGAVKPTDTLRVPRVAYATDLSSVDTIGWYNVYPVADVIRERITVEDQSAEVPRPPLDTPLQFNTPDGFIHILRKAATTMEDAAFTVTRLDMSGDTIFSRRLKYTPQSYTSEMLDSIAARVRVAVQKGFSCDESGVCQAVTVPVTKDVAQLLRARMRFPGYMLPVDWASFGTDSSVWVRRAHDVGNALQWIVFSQAGEPVGRVEIPKGQAPILLSLNELWIIQPDENDVPFLVKYRLVR